VGAHLSGLIGDSPVGIPNNLFPIISSVAAGELSHVVVFGDDYNTKDGTGVRDYIHVVDLAEGHLASLEKIESLNGLFIYNLGTGIGCSVLECIKLFENITGKQIKHVTSNRRNGDIPYSVANPLKANDELGWRASRDLVVMCRDEWSRKQRIINKSQKSDLKTIKIQ
jgi:UDP-glucose 4-epimerase